MALIAFHPVVETMEKTTTRKLPQYPKLKREKVVILRPVSPKVAKKPGKRQLMRLVTTMIGRLSQKASPMLGPTMPVLSVATAMFALSLVGSAVHTGHVQRLMLCPPERACVPDMRGVLQSFGICDSLYASRFDR